MNIQLLQKPNVSSIVEEQDQSKTFSTGARRQVRPRGMRTCDLKTDGRTDSDASRRTERRRTGENGESQTNAGHRE